MGKGGITRITASSIGEKIYPVSAVTPLLNASKLAEGAVISAHLAKTMALQPKEEFNAKREIIPIIFASILFILGIIFRKKLHHTPYSLGEYLVFISTYLLSGWGILNSAGRNIIRGRIFDENFLLTVATLGAISIQELPEAAGVMLFFKIGEFFQNISVARSRRSIKSLLEIRPDYANLKIGEQIRRVSPERVSVGDTIIVRPGEKIPLDGEVIMGSSYVDTSALTGESIPRGVKAGDTVLAGMINKTGMLTIKVTKGFGESSISKILNLVERASSKKAGTEKFITKFAHYYTPIVVFGALGVALIPPLLITEASLSSWVHRALVLLVISCPCALVISIPLGYFGGIGGAARRGILIKGSNFLDALTAVRTIVFDKTGTLTKGVFKVVQIVPKNGFTEREILQLAAVAESQSNHPIAVSILEAYGRPPSLEVQNYEEIAGYGIKATIQNRVILAGNDPLLHREGIKHDVCDIEGTVIHIAIDGIYAGYIVIADEIKEDALMAMQFLRALGIEKIIMLTGDNKRVARMVANKLGLDNYLAELLPEEKVSAIERLIDDAKEGEKVSFVGDGINDAPVIARADIGIAMGAMGSDAAIDIADVVIMTDAPSKVAEAIKIGKKTKKIVWENIGLAFVIKGVFIGLGILGIATMWEAVFADVGVALMAILNATRVLR